MAERVLYAGMVHWVRRVRVGFDSNYGYSTTHLCVRFFCSGLLNLQRSAQFVHRDVNCMSCLVIQARERKEGS